MGVGMGGGREISMRAAPSLRTMATDQARMSPWKTPLYQAEFRGCGGFRGDSLSGDRGWVRYGTLPGCFSGLLIVGIDSMALITS